MNQSTKVLTKIKFSDRALSKPRVLLLAIKAPNSKMRHNTIMIENRYNQINVLHTKPRIEQKHHQGRCS